MIAAGLAWAAVGAAAITWGSISPRSNLWGRVITRGSSGKQGVALTFDDGPTPGATNHVLDILADYRVPAAFFVVGINVEKSPELIRRMHDEGHVVGNHSFNHSNVGFFRGGRYWRGEIDRTSNAIESAIGRRPALFRPPMGVKTWLIHAAARRHHQAIVTWTRRAFDGVATTPDRIVERLSPHTQPGDILLLHDGVRPNYHRDMFATIGALPRLIAALRNRGLNFMRLDELIGLPPYTDEENP